MRCRKGTLCDYFILSSSVTVTGTDLIINIPTMPGRCGCLAIAQNIPDTATVNMPVFITVGTDTTQYPLVDCCGVAVSAGRIEPRFRYKFKYVNASTTPVFKLSGARCPYNAI